ncbi:MAG: hypothetical protein WA418_17360 [Bradyrhizobium sp.]
MATISRLKSGSWRAQVRRKGKYVNETFLRRKDAEEWGIDIERRIDRQELTTTHKSRDVQLFDDLITLHHQDLEEVGKDIGRSKTASLIFLDERLGHLRLPELDREVHQIRKSNRSQLVVSSDLPSQRLCGKVKLQDSKGATSTPQQCWPRGRCYGGISALWPKVESLRHLSRPQTDVAHALNVNAAFGSTEFQNEKSANS